jgi:hypothetical protein
MNANWNRPISRRRLLSRAIAGAALVTPMRWLGSPVLVHATRSTRPLPATEFDAAVPTAWFDVMLRLIQRTPGYTPPVAARAMGCAGVALYEAAVPGMPDHRSLGAVINGFGDPRWHGRSEAYHWPAVANAALAGMARDLFPTAPADLAAEIEQLESTLQGDAPGGIRERSANRGRAIAAAVIEWSKTDGGHEGYLRNFPSDYIPPEGPGLWVPTPPGFLPALQPYWGSNRCMALPSAAACDPGPPPAFSTDDGSAFLAQAREVYDTVNQITPEQEAIALFWADDPGGTPTPPGHSVSILTQVLRARDATLADAAEAYARLGIAICDAFIACWRVKYVHNLIRPITYIRRHIDPAWGDPLPVTTPPFPEYTSGHSIQSAAAATVLTSLFGPVAFTDHSHDERGLAPRSFGSFDEFAEEAAISRLYGGIHYRAAIVRGLSQGRCVGEAVAALPLRG